MQLTRNYKLSQFTATNTGLPNIPRESHKNNIRFIASKLQYIRDNICLPLTIVGGFRTEPVNRALRGSNVSLHLSGSAVDILIDAIPATLMPKFMDFVLDTEPHEIYFHSHQIMHLSWINDSLNIKL